MVTLVVSLQDGGPPAKQETLEGVEIVGWGGYPFILLAGDDAHPGILWAEIIGVNTVGDNSLELVLKPDHELTHFAKANAGWFISNPEPALALAA
ncbi:MAG: hypothetical protein COT81_04875 [Candidatus Buchananbacteria bacterium CG10_big_fil_rev_8_21_14_0_10_42_9]|uniref:Uncharacterized protein n=1 Tax=Candidatus Buchananbacteria bacterium CG10_big_fil_rev_8_21_14_0_10_42_9 TaxID=1974526 RepID=A0A2H0W052_9BACT|nr:MAG: hypothetical protein COT81_04875 [Candidatus Buchananbacteria bacterium CG10_big_fil_rev_8_21_14_0_10_42_9]